MIGKLIRYMSSRLHSLKSQLLVLFLVMGILPIAGLSWYGYSKMVDNILQMQGDILNDASSLNVEGLRSKFTEAEHDIEYWASLKSRRELLNDIKNEWKKSNQPLKLFVRSDAFKMIEKNHTDTRALADYKAHDPFVYDLLLIDKEGNILYSLMQENDLGTNVMEGPLQSTLFGKTVRKTLLEGKGYFSDLERYAPSKDVVTGFITEPMRDESGVILGVMVMQLDMPIMLESFEHTKNDKILNYLIGSDSLLRTSIETPDEILNRSMKHKAFLKWHSEHIMHGNTQENMIEKAVFYTGAYKVPVLGQHQNFEFRGVKWAHISEMNEKRVMAVPHSLLLAIFLFAAVAGIVIIYMANVFAKHITDPISRLSKASIDFMQGDKSVQVTINTGNELDAFSHVFNQMIQTQNENEKHLQKLLNDLKEQKHALDLHSIVGITDVKGNITFANKKLEEISGYTQEELIGQNHRLLNSGLQPSSYWKAMYETVRHGRVWQDTVRNKAKDGHFYWVDTTIVPFMDENNKPVSYIAIRTDLTERMKMEEELRIAKDEAESSSRSKSEFLAAMSHEIRTPMNGVLGMLGLLEHSDLDNTQRHHVHVAHSSAISLLGLINDILDFSKIEAGKMDLEDIEFNLYDELGEFVEVIAFKAEEKGLKLILNTDGITHPNIIADSGRLRQILTNLIGNAVKFTHQGQIAIKVTLLKEDDTYGKLCIDVADTGIGIPPEKIDTLFEAFTQADGSTTRKYGGTGLGLSIVKRLCELMGGSVCATSSPGEGSTFSVTLQVKLGSDQIITKKVKKDIESSQEEHVLWPESTRILLVEDNTTNQIVALGMLESIGLQADIAADGLEALESLRLATQTSSPYTLILMDCQMPEMDGYTASTQIRAGKAGEANTKIPIVAMTANAMSGDREKCILSGMDDYISKPINLSTLKATLLKWLLNGGSIPMNTTPMFEEKAPQSEFLLWDKAEALERLGGKEKLLKMVVDSFLKEGPQIIKNLSRALKNGDLKEAQLHAHSIKGTCGNIGAKKLQEIAKQIEHAAQEGSIEKIKDLYPEFKEVYTLTINTLQKDQLAPLCIVNMTLLNNELGLPDKIIYKLLAEFLNTSYSSLLELKTAIDANDFNRIESIGHKIKGAAGNMRFFPIEKLSGEIEMLAQSKKNADYPKLYRDLEKMMNTVGEEIKTLIAASEED